MTEKSLPGLQVSPDGEDFLENEFQEKRLCYCDCIQKITHLDGEVYELHCVGPVDMSQAMAAATRICTTK